MFAATRAGIMTSKGGSGPGPRHWRLLVTALGVGAYYASVNEIELRGSVGGIDLTTPSTPITHTLGGTDIRPVSGMVDGDVGTAWLSEGGASAPFSITFDLLVPTQVKQIAIYPGDIYNVARSPASFVVQKSSDGLIFEDVKTFTNVAYGAYTWKTFDL